jgi:hypothetical protein
MLEFDSGISVKAGGGPSKVRRTERHQMTAKIGKAAKAAENSQRKARRIEDRKWEKGGIEHNGQMVTLDISLALSLSRSLHNKQALT